MTSSSVNIVNLENLPQLEEILNGNFLIVNTPLGISIIDWSKVTVLKLDSAGSGTFEGTLTGGNFFGGIGSFNTLSATNIYSAGKQGVSNTFGYFNKFGTTNGITYSATYVTGSPEYVDLLYTQIPAATAYAFSTIQSTISNINVYEKYANPTVSTGNSTAVCIFTELPSGLVSTDLNTADFNIGYTGVVPLTCNPYVGAFGVTNNNVLTATLTLRQVAPSDMNFNVKVSKHF